MAKQIKTQRKAKSGIEPRDFLLAGVGAVSLTRKQGIKLYGALLDEGKSIQDRVEQGIESLKEQAVLGVEIVRERMEAVVTPIRARFDATYGTVKSEVESRLAPVLDKFGVKRSIKTRATTGAKRAVRKTKAATKRVVRKARAA